MKIIHLVVAAMLCASSAAFAAKHRIDRVDGQISLDDSVPCPYKGKSAMLITNTLIGFGCWETQGDYVYIWWYESMGPTGMSVRIDMSDRFPKPASLR